jgi:hypothetical protein
MEREDGCGGEAGQGAGEEGGALHQHRH